MLQHNRLDANSCFMKTLKADHCTKILSMGVFQGRTATAKAQDFLHVI